MKKLLLAGLVLAMSTVSAQAKDLNKIGISLGSLGNPFFVTMVNGATAKAKEYNPNAEVIAVSADYDLNKQFTQVDNFIAAGVDMILINAVDANAIEVAIKRAQKEGIAVVAVDVSAKGADATVQTNNVQAGEIACQYIVDKLGGKGDVIIQNGPQVSAVIDRVNGCRSVFAKAPGINVLSDDQDAKGSRDGGLNVMQGHLTRFQKIDAVFTINDPQAIGTDLAAKQLKRDNIIITSVDGAPDIEEALKGNTMVEASASQDPYAMAQMGVDVGVKILNGEKPAESMILMPSTLVTRENVGEYKGWTSER
ncbi:ABC transporter substrate-binding protein [Desulfopila aestuarii]|uniref:Monosaccharide ABC transporter substrate-binding protein, CUT2 family (TC 3.A.1.2.-) n=2 Tax=Desulfopila aestuarii TaxID=231440 RepID=A0A1M7XVQ5_9BACT|nr:ABC transporter substrate-binding protein [Desulfopila aestuarii]SHO42735.1 monosaccharide ABC transporter substrate-binding protein, CUT2 family (TC 3.A.1.2.-) [Desulfopila aestuarii DSM 18488]